jgi:phytoene dehydrogenase-like protein
MRQLLDHIAALSPMDQQPARELAEATETVRMGASRDSEDRTAPADIRRRFARIEESLNALTVAEYAKRFSHPAIQGGLRSLVPSYYSAFSLVWTLSQLSLGDGNWPLGGSMSLARSVESTFVSLGGRVHSRKRAAKIIVRGNRACGIMLDDGTEVEGDAVVAAMDVHQTLFGLLEEDRVPTRIRRWFETVRTVTPAVQISLGIRSASLDCPPHLVWELDKQATVAGTAQRVIDLLYFGDDPSMAGPGTSVMTCLVDSDYEFWKKLTPNRAAYDEEKERTAAWAIEEVCRRIPGARSCVETVDVATPVTHARMAGVWKGAYEGWNFDRATCRIRFPQTLPNLEGFYMTGQWIKPGGGLTAAMTTGNETIELIRKEEDRA